MRSETEQLIASISTEEAEKMYDNLVKRMFGIRKSWHQF